MHSRGEGAREDVRLPASQMVKIILAGYAKVTFDCVRFNEVWPREWLGEKEETRLSCPCRLLMN